MERSCSRVMYCFLGLLVFCLGFCANALATPETLYREGVPEIRGPKSTALKQLPDFTPLARTVSGAIVNISVEGKGEDETTGELAPFPFNNSPEIPSRSTGSGFLISPDGYIATSNHVVDKASRIIVRILNDKNEYTATLIGKDPKTDVALLKIDAGRSLPFTYLGDSDEVEVGEWVIAIGNQFELGQTLTLGIVSAKARRVPSTGGSPYDVY
ncbi:MAG: trypsin-like serine protease, partial [SAR324 cluster bacterium]|nr:trypsin-like serine protease [SAR324 cluster bacterium]